MKGCKLAMGLSADGHSSHPMPWEESAGLAQRPLRIGGNEEMRKHQTLGLQGKGAGKMQA